MDKVTPQSSESNDKKRGGDRSSAAFGISDRELAKKDGLQQKLTLSFDWIVAHKVLILMAIGVLVLSGAGYVLYGQVKRDTQLKIQDQYYAIEKDYLKIKNDFEEADRQAKADASKALEKKNDKKKKDESKQEPKPEMKAQATGDMEKDYGSVIKRFSDLLIASPQSIPGKVAALVLADIYTEHSKFDLAAQVLDKSSVSPPKDLVDFMVLKKWSSVQLSLGNFDQVIKKNQPAMASTKYPFMTSYFKLQTGLAHEGLKQFDVAEALFKEVAAKGDVQPMPTPEQEKLKNHFSADQSASEMAQKYLLLLRLKKSDTQAGT